LFYLFLQKLIKIWILGKPNRGGMVARGGYLLTGFRPRHYKAEKGKEIAFSTKREGL